ncbi:MAG: DUF1499 domain-containing protein [Desulfuromonadales bacterium]
MKTSAPKFFRRPAVNLLLFGLVFLMASCTSAPQNIGPINGRLRPCPPTPNCVCSEGDEDSSSWIAPLRYQGPPELAWQRLKGVVREAGGHIEEERTDYLRATFTSKIFRFRDDVEFRLAPGEGILHVRSASRLGYFDFGVNRKRVEKLRRMLETASGGD